MTDLKNFAQLMKLAVADKNKKLCIETVTETKDLVSESLTLLSTKPEIKQQIPSVSLDTLKIDIDNLKKVIESRKISHVTSGSGEVRILRMDDINISNLANGRMLVWDSNYRKFKFVDVPVASNLGRPTLIVTSNYIVTNDDYYIGVQSSNEQILITLPDTFVNGKEIIVKDESGNASLLPIKLIGTIDNDPSGAEIAINNGSISMINRNGWRIK